MTSVTQVFAVPVARDDYCQKDTLDLALDALQCLDRTCNEIFNRVEATIDAAAARLKDANQRIDAARFRVNKITGVTSATTIFSKPTYPKGGECSTYQPVLSDLGFTDVAEPFEEDEEAEPFQVDEHGGATHPRELRELYKSVNPDLSFTELGQKAGLGRLPTHLPSVSSMLLFNSTATPYKQYSTINTLLGEDLNARDDHEEKFEMEHAPDTFMNDQSDNGVQTVDFGFVPAAVEIDASSLNFMDNLALPGIADNVNYQTAPEGLQSFAPSILKQQQGAGFLALEDVAMPGFESGSTAPAPAAGPPPPPQGGMAAAAPPPPPPNFAPAPAVYSAPAAPPPPGPGGVAPPPPAGMPPPPAGMPPPPGGMPPPPGGMPPPPGGMPPPPGGMPPPPGGMPPPPGGPPVPGGPPIPVSVPAPAPAPKMASAGGDLLAAIRAGKRLKSSKKKPSVKQKPKPKKKPSLGDDLAATLARRAKSMRGGGGRKTKKRAAPKKASALPDLGSSSEEEAPSTFAGKGMAALDSSDEDSVSSEVWSESD